MANALLDLPVLELGGERRNDSGFVLTASLACVALIALADYATGYELRLAILYLTPIAISTWLQGRWAGVLVSASAATTWLFVFQSSHQYSRPFFYYWEGGLAVTTYVAFVLLIDRLRQVLSRSDERFVTVLEGLDAAVFAAETKSGQIVYGNRRFRDVHGGERPKGISSDAPPAEIFDERSGHWYLVHSRALRWVDGRDVTLYVLSDVSEAKKARELVMQHREAAHRQSRLTALGEFASTVAHELTQPLAAISTYNNVALRLLDGSDAGDPAELREAMRKSGDQARRAGAIIHRLRELLRQPGPELQPLDLNQIASAALRLAEPETEESGVEAALALAPGLVPVQADGLLIEQVILNLLRNAIAATRRLPAERRRVRLATAITAAGDAALAVTDRGEGVSAAIAGHLFEPFVSARPSGLGLGLAICRSVIESHGGTIEYRPHPDGGSIFQFTLPRRAP